MPSQNKQSEYKQIKHGGIFFDILTGESSLFVKEHKRWLQRVCFVFHTLKTQPNSALPAPVCTLSNWLCGDLLFRFHSKILCSQTFRTGTTPKLTPPPWSLPAIPFWNQIRKLGNGEKTLGCQPCFDVVAFYVCAAFFIKCGPINHVCQDTGGATRRRLSYGWKETDEGRSPGK